MLVTNPRSRDVSQGDANGPEDRSAPEWPRLDPEIVPKVSTANTRRATDQRGMFGALVLSTMRKPRIVVVEDVALEAKLLLRTLFNFGYTLSLIHI